MNGIGYILSITLAGIMQATVSTCAAVVLGWIFARCVYRQVGWMAHLWGFVPLIFFVMPSKVAVLAIGHTYGATGMLAIILTHVFLNAPFAFSCILSWYQVYDQQIAWLACDAGASTIQTITCVEWPCIKHLIHRTAAIVFVLCFSTFSIPRMVGTAWYHYSIDSGIFNAYTQGQWQYVAGGICLRLLLLTPLIMTNTHKPVYTNRRLYWPYRNSSFAGRLIAGLGLLAMMIPLCIIFYYAWHHGFIMFWKTILIRDPLLGVSVLHLFAVTLLVATLSTVGVLIAAAAYSYIALMYKQLGWIQVVIMTPLLLGGVVVGILSMFFVGISGGALWVLVISHMFLNFPYVVRMIQSSAGEYSPEWYALARSCGASWLQALCVHMRFARAALVRAGIIAWGLSFAEVGAASVVGKAYLTIPVATRLYYHAGMTNNAIHLSVGALICVFVIIVYIYFVEDI